MNVYHIKWIYDGRLVVNAVVIAADEQMAVACLDIHDEDHTDIDWKMLGPCTDGTSEPKIVCREM